MDEFYIEELLQMTTVKEEETAKIEAVNHPSHYNTGQIEVIDAILDWDLSFCLGNVVKYVARAGKKNKETYLEDLRKAAWYLAKEIEVQSKN